MAEFMCRSSGLLSVEGLCRPSCVRVHPFGKERRLNSRGVELLRRVVSVFRLADY